jgi:hypothetical protein
MTLDEFCAQAATWPNALKLDVDGGENRVLAGARTVLSRAEFRTLIAEVDGGGLHSDIVAMLGGAGLRRAKNARPSEAGNQVWQR